MITYDETGGSIPTEKRPLPALWEGKRVGEIRKLEKGFRFFPDGKRPLGRTSRFLHDIHVELEDWPFCGLAQVYFLDGENFPKDGERVIVHVPKLDVKGLHDGVYMGWYVAACEEWFIDGSPSAWIVDWWFSIPSPEPV